MSGAHCPGSLPVGAPWRMSHVPHWTGAQDQPKPRESGLARGGRGAGFEMNFRAGNEIKKVSSRSSGPQIPDGRA